MSVVRLLLFAFCLATGHALSDDDADAGDTTPETKEVRRDTSALNEDPEARRKAEAQAGIEDAPTAEKDSLKLELYASVRVHGINTFKLESDAREFRIGDGQSRFGARGNWEYARGWELFARAELGLDVVEQFSTRAPELGDGGLKQRLLFAGIDSDNLTLTYGKDWSAYYRIAGMTDRFAIFGGSASGVYNAGTVGEATGTGRADDVLKSRIYLDSEWGIFKAFKPANLNLQLQRPQPIPRVPGQSYDGSFGGSIWIETETEYGIGLAYNRSRIENLASPSIVAAGIDGDAIAAAVSARAFGDRWYVSLLISRLENIETTDIGRYVNADGIEVYGQWEVRKNWWLIGGLNALEPDGDDPDAGQYRVRYAVLGGRYSFDSFRRMAYLEYRIDDGRTFAGELLENEITVGVRWDFGN